MTQLKVEDGLEGSRQHLAENENGNDSDDDKLQATLLDKIGYKEDKIIVLVKGIDMELFYIEAHLSDTIGSAKAKIHAKMGFSIASQRLIFECKRLNDDMTFSSIHLNENPKHQDLFHLELEFDGGGKPGTKKKLKAEKMHVAMAKATYLGGFLRDF
jgi:hypothetical protein